ncbi:MAG: SGNH/GDSL hydrolase family protein [Verrucomicrobiales bacterium]|nr:SGNH/GDSL hydrolase family protein [Verrucomicrobiales bacterium]
MKLQSMLWLFCLTLILVPARGYSAGEPTNAKEAAAQKAEKAKKDALTNKKFAEWKAGLPKRQQQWETTLEENLGGFYLPIYKRAKVKNKPTAWDYVEDDPALPRVLLIGDSVSRGYTEATRRALAGKANLHRAPENCGPTATALKKLDVWLGEGDWDVIHFNFGIHDRRTPVTDYEQRLRTLIKRLKARGKVLIWASTTPIPEDWQEGAKATKAVEEHNAVAAKVMKSEGIVTDDLYALILPRLAELQNAKDVHFKGEGYEVLGTQVAKSILAQLPKQSKLVYKDAKKQRYHLSARASKLDSRTKEYPEIGFVFGNDKKPQDLQNAMVDTSIAPRGKLVIWMMGHNSRLFERLADYGLHAVQIAYAKQWFGKVCLEKPVGEHCRGNVRIEAATGEDFSKDVAIAKPDGMMERARQFVTWLAKENPQGGWDYFLTADGKDLRWQDVIMAGSSHGSTTSARFAKYKKVSRVVMLCGPRDQHQVWQKLPSATPENRYFGFSHVLDGGWTGDHYCRSWELIGMNKFGPIVNVDQSKPPFENSRRLITDFDVKGNVRRAHSSVQPGGSAWKDEKGNFVHEAVWQYLFTHPVDQVGKATPLDPHCDKE